eukprot:TRINITY_DN65050_c0_g1_i1.p1 TRINITY_DN65050_c0_g1~~TRINITY_DN65050_c0_g1_i1.p1  ORF type:complete len:516 (+),score=119.28 TRINITY_DN65050_c0_g1_i1:110-1657(+)
MSSWGGGAAAEPLVPSSSQDSPRRTLNVADEEVRLGEEERYLGNLRKALGVPDNFLAGNVNFGDIAPGGGKGGDAMCTSLCGYWLVKELGVNDKRSLCDPGFLAQYVAYIMQARDGSLLARIVCVFQRNDGQWFHVMNNWLPAGPPWSALYDLKGNRDDKLLISDGEKVPQIHKRFWNCPWLIGECCRLDDCCGVPIDRQRYAEGKRQAFHCQFHFTPRARTDLLAALRSDCAFLKRRGLMDYSLICGVLRTTADYKLPVRGPGAFFAPPIIGRRGPVVWVYYLGIIDFLQGWNTKKKVAHVVKLLFAPKPISTVEPGRYASQFCESFERRFLGDAADVPLPAAAEERAPAPAPAASAPPSTSPTTAGPEPAPAPPGAGGGAGDILLASNGSSPLLARPAYSPQQRATPSLASTANGRSQRRVCPLAKGVGSPVAVVSPRREGPLITVVCARTGERQQFHAGAAEDPEALVGAIRGAFGVAEHGPLPLVTHSGQPVTLDRLLAQGPGEEWLLDAG